MSKKASMACAGAFAAAATLTGSAFAADLAPPPPPVPVFTWTGLYVGGQVGYAWGQDPVTWFGTANDLDPAGGAFTENPQGVIGGAHVGYNLQLNPWWVIGAEGSADGTSLRRTVVVPLIDFAGDTFGSATATSSASVQGSIRGRIGVAWDRALIYGTGGVAFSSFNTSLTDTAGFFTGVPGTLPALRTRVLVGRLAAASNMPSPTIGGCGPSTATRISATPRTFRSTLCSPRAAFFPCGTISRKTKSKSASATGSTGPRRPPRSPWSLSQTLQSRINHVS